MVRWVFTVGTALAITVGAVIALGTPIQLASRDHLGRPVACGDALRADSSLAQAADDHYQRLHNNNPDRFTATDYQHRCAAIIAEKRRHAMIVSAAAAAVMGVLGGLVLVFPSARSRTPTLSRRHRHRRTVTRSAGLVSDSPEVSAIPEF